MTPALEHTLEHLATTGPFIAYGIAAAFSAVTIWLCFTPVLARYNVKWDSGRPVNWRVVGGILLASFFIFGMVARRDQVLAHNLRTHGVISTGRIIEKKRVRGRKERRRWRMQYEHRVNGRTFIGSQVCLHQEGRLRRAEVGETFVILYNAREPSQSIMDLSAPVSDDSTSPSW